MNVISVAIPNNCDADIVKAELEKLALEKYGTADEKVQNAPIKEVVVGTYANPKVHVQNDSFQDTPVINPNPNLSKRPK